MVTQGSLIFVAGQFLRAVLRAKSLLEESVLLASTGPWHKLEKVTHFGQTN